MKGSEITLQVSIIFQLPSDPATCISLKIEASKKELEMLGCQAPHQTMLHQSMN
jgi:hypothetical protein